ncbi:phage portal protein [Apilactobacillus xinyiensis]|uniref:phage portal protein n=1 Tax=Apilactobacillus xinyiensis TaxID=2841032 RepID=UPI00200FFDDB|nr:phage portal protein [Apilactobacillus xinyiensis]MCL0330840.1 phage portal protein [Apilactobacillus xinyiensis]
MDDNDVLHASPNFDVTQNWDQVQQLLSAYSGLYKIYHAKMRVYKGDHAALHETYFSPLLNESEENMSINVPKNMVNTFAGFFAGIPAKVNYVPSGQSVNDPLDEKSKAINDWISKTLNDSHYSDIMYEWAKKADIYGRGYAIAYVDNDKDVHFKDLSPENCLIVYDNSLNENPLFAIYFVKLNNSYAGTVFTNDKFYDFNNTALSGDMPKGKTNPLGKVPVAELPENDERLGMFDDAISAIDKLDKAFSLKFNDYHYFSNAILFLVGFDKLNKMQADNIMRLHVLQPIDENGKAPDTSDGQTIDAKYLAKPQNDQQQEHFLDRVTSQIYQNAQIINLSDPQLGATASGDALGKKLQPMVMLADAKARKMTNAFKQILSIMLTQCNLIDNSEINQIVADTQVKFTPNIPQSLLDESNIVKNLNGIVSTPTLLSYLSNINNVPQELQQILAEKKQNAKEYQNATNSDNDNDGDYPTNNENGSNSNNGSDKDE